MNSNNRFLTNEVLIICSKNREKSLLTTLQHCLISSKIPETLILSLAEYSHISPAITSLTSEFNKAIILQSDKSSLPYQRNKALEAAPENTRLIHFIDDDFWVEQNYFSELSDYLHNNSDCVGAGGKIEPITQKKVGLYHRIFLLDSLMPGTILRSGRTTEPQSTQFLNYAYSTLFLSGCSMSFEFNSIRNLQFDENLTGYAQDEDLAFCLALLPNNLAVVPTAIGFHVKSTSQRLDYFNLKQSSVINRFYVMSVYYSTHFSKVAFFWSIFGQFLILLKQPMENWERIKGLLSGGFHVFCFQIGLKKTYF